MASLRRIGSSLAALACGMGFLLLVAGPVVADHAYSHRYVVMGRVIDALGEPVQGVQVAVSMEGFESNPLPPCPQAPTTRSTTDGWGDYFYCFHTHSYSAAARVVITVRQQAYTQAADVDMRNTVQNVQLTTQEPGLKDPTVVAKFRRTVTVWGRVWQAQPGAVIEGIQVNGVVLTGTGVHLTLSSNAGSDVWHAVTDGYGDFGHRAFERPTTVTSGTVTMALTEASGTKTVAVDTTFMVADGSDFRIPADNPVLVVLRGGWPFLVALGAIVAVVFVVARYRPKRSRRHDVSRIPGVGRAKTSELRAAGYTTVERLAAANSKEVSEKTSLSPKEAKRIVKKAKDILEGEKGEVESEGDEGDD